MYYAALKNNYKLEAYMNSIEIYNASSEEFVELVNEHLKKNNLSLKTIKEAIQKTDIACKKILVNPIIESCVINIDK